MRYPVTLARQNSHSLLRPVMAGGGGACVKFMPVRIISIVLAPGPHCSVAGFPIKNHFPHLFPTPPPSPVSSSRNVYARCMERMGESLLKDKDVLAIYCGTVNLDLFCHQTQNTGSLTGNQYISYRCSSGRAGDKLQAGGEMQESYSRSLGPLIPYRRTISSEAGG